MPLLGELGIVKGCIRRFKIGAAVLLVSVEEEGVEAPVEVIMARDIVFRTSARIELAGMPDEIAQPPLQLGPTRQYFGLIKQDRQCIRNRALLDDESAFHVELAQCKLRVQKDPAFAVGGEESRRDRLAGPLAAGECCPACRRERHPAAANELLQEIPQQTVHRNHPRAIPYKLAYTPSTPTLWRWRWLPSVSRGS